MVEKRLSPRNSLPTPLAQLLQQAEDRLRPPNTQRVTDGFLFAGNRHEAVPRSLFTDSRLTPIERNAWQVLRMLLDDEGVTSMPTYEQLRPYLSSTPCGGVASDETIARTLTLLRLARWLTLVSRQRDPSNGRIRGNLYVLHDAPLTPSEVIQLDPEYLSLVSRCLTHAGKAIQRLGRWTLQEVVDDPLIAEHVLPSRLQILSAQLAAQSWAQPTPSGLVNLASESEDSEPPSESEDGSAAEKSRLRIPKTASTVRSTSDEIEVRTVPRAHETTRLRYPEPFGSLKPDQQSGALEALRRVPPELQQAVLDDWSMRCREASVRNPAGYLFGIIQSALQGTFNVYANRRRPSRRT